MELSVLALMLIVALKVLWGLPGPQKETCCDDTGLYHGRQLRDFC